MTWTQIQNRAHAAVAALSAVALAVSGAATVIAGIITEFGGHVSALDLSAKTAAVSTGALLLSKLIDSANNALGGSTTPAPPVTAGPAAGA